MPQSIHVNLSFSNTVGPEEIFEIIFLYRHNYVKTVSPIVVPPDPGEGGGNGSEKLDFALYQKAFTFVCLFIYCFTSRLRIFHLHGNVTNASEGL
jgi:hypothetical protein